MNDQALSNCALFNQLAADDLDLLVAGGKQYAVPADHVFLDIDDANDALFVVLTGRVRIQRPGTETDVELATLGSGAIFGEMSFMDGSKTTARVSAVEATEVLELNSGDFHRLLSDRPVLAAMLWRNLALEFRDRLTSTNQLVDYYADLAQVLRDNPGAASLLGT